MAEPEPLCGCCQEPFLPRRPSLDPWEGRLDGYCDDCAHARCDAGPGDCGKRRLVAEPPPVDLDALRAAVHRDARTYDLIDRVLLAAVELEAARQELARLRSDVGPGGWTDVSHESAERLWERLCASRSVVDARTRACIQLGAELARRTAALAELVAAWDEADEHGVVGNRLNEAQNAARAALAAAPREVTDG